MIIRDRPSGLRLFFVFRGSILSRMWKVLAANIALATLVTFAHGFLFNFKVTLTAIPFTLIGLPLAIFLGFCNNTAYDRYWESRKLWGALITESQNLARQCLSLIGGATPITRSLGLADYRVRMISRAIAYAHALRVHLRGISDDDAIRPWLQADEWEQAAHARNRPNFLMLRMGADLRGCLEEGRIDACMTTAIDSTFSAMTAVAMGCERIKNTPIPFSYTLLLHRTAYLYCFLLPFGLVDTIGIMTPFVVAIVAYTFFALDALGDEIEEPFGLERNDLPLDALCRHIEINLRESMHDPAVPPPLHAVDYLLM